MKKTFLPAGEGFVCCLPRHIKNAVEDFAGILQRAVQNLNHGEKHFIAKI